MLGEQAAGRQLRTGGQAPGADGFVQLLVQLFGQILAAVDHDVQFHVASQGFSLRQDYALARWVQNGLRINRPIGYRAYVVGLLGWDVISENCPMEPRLDYYTASPQALKGMLMLEATLFDLSVEKPLLELVKIRVSQVNHCAFCTDMHGQAALSRGETPRRLLALCVWQESPLFSARERAALAWSDAITTLATSDVPDAVYQVLRREFTEQEAVDLTMAVSTISGWNRLAVAFRQRPPG